MKILKVKIPLDTLIQNNIFLHEGTKIWVDDVLYNLGFIRDSVVNDKVIKKEVYSTNSEHLGTIGLINMEAEQEVVMYPDALKAVKDATSQKIPQKEITGLNDNSGFKVHSPFPRDFDHAIPPPPQPRRRTPATTTSAPLSEEVEQVVEIWNSADESSSGWLARMMQKYPHRRFTVDELTNGRFEV